jgi:Glycosyl hydrolases family 43
MIDRVRRKLFLQLPMLSGLALSACAGHRTAPDEAETSKRYRSFHPGELWLDTAGKPIQAHGGSVIAVGNTFYWYGENKEFTDGKSGIESWGIRFYSSQDLYNWTDLGALIPPDQTDPTSPLSPKVFPERPHILFNAATGRFVCWIKIRGRGPQFRTVLEADAITGPYRLVHADIRPAGMPAGDFDLVQDEDTGKAWMYFEHEHREVVCVELTSDYLGFTDRYTRHLPGQAPNTCEGIACFTRKGKLYLTSSGMTGYFPNPSRVAASADPHGPFTDLGLLHANDRSETSFGSQISDIFKIPGKDLYIAMADRWLPDLWTDPQFQSGEMSRLAPRLRPSRGRR